jgi:hypothetical protein
MTILALSTLALLMMVLKFAVVANAPNAALALLPKRPLCLTLLSDQEPLNHLAARKLSPAYQRPARAAQ